MTADDIDLASRGLIEFIKAQHAGKDLSRAQQNLLKVNIRKHSSIAGLFFPSAVTFFVYVHLLIPYLYILRLNFTEEEDVVME
jgi:hypothetical protein